MNPPSPIVSIRWRPWRLPLRDPVAIGATGGLSERAGLIVRVETVDGGVGLGESAPLPGEGIGVEALAARAGEVSPALLGQTPGEAWASLRAIGFLPSADVALETAFIDLCARACDAPFAEWFADWTGLAPLATEPIPVNALLTAAAPADLAREAAAARASGFRTVKVKVGRDRAADGERLGAVRAALGPEVAIRIDANGAWSEDEALAALTAHASRGVALCEQPLTPGFDAPARLARLRAASPIPIAADESCASVRDLRALCAANAVDAVVIKPLRTGLAEAFKMILEAVSRGASCILTTTFDSGIGTALAIQLASLLRAPRMACGLATLPLLGGDIVRGCPVPEGGAIALPAAPGLGVEIDEAALERFASGPWDGVAV